jgi:hypothetical protein
MVESEGSCKLCMSAGPLRRSHIVPEFLYKPLYDQKHSFSGIADSGRLSTLQIGLRERMLCQDCEARLQKWEDKAARVLRQLPDLSAQLP